MHRSLIFFFLVLVSFFFMASSVLSAEFTVGVGDWWGNFNLKYQKYEVQFESDGIGMLGGFAEFRFLDNQLGIGANFVSGKYSFEGSGTTDNAEELTASGSRDKKDLDLWVKYSPSRHFGIFGGYKTIDFNFNDIVAVWTVPEGKTLEGEADLKVKGFAVGMQTAFGRRLVAVISLSYFPALSGDVSWDGRKRDPGQDWETDSGTSTVDMQGFKFQFNLVKPFPSINSALTLGYYLQIITDNFDTINYRTDELFTGLMLGFSYTFRFGGPSEVNSDSPFDKGGSDEGNSGSSRSMKIGSF
jgi:hypothetical protein